VNHGRDSERTGPMFRESESPTVNHGRDSERARATYMGMGKVSVSACVLLAFLVVAGQLEPLKPLEFSESFEPSPWLGPLRCS
jgi:hypothetical protein